MRFIAILGFLCMCLASVWAAPALNLNKAAESDDIEQELVRQHHATQGDTNDQDDNSYSEEKGNIHDESSPVDSIEDVPEDTEQNSRMYDQDDLYDITVGDVIRDVLMTLHDNPEIVKAMMETEKEKIATKLAQDAFDNVGTDLSEYQLPAIQLQSVPKRVEKKDGNAEHAREAAAANELVGYQGMGVENADDAEFNGFMNHKRTNEVLDETFSQQPDNSDDSNEQYEKYKNFVKATKQGVNKYKALYGSNSDSDSDSDSESYRRHFEDKSDSESDESNVKQKVLPPGYRFRFINPFAYYSNFRGDDSSDQSSSSQSSDSSNQVKGQETGSDETDTKSSDSSSDSSEEQLSWLLKEMGAHDTEKESQQNM